MVEELACKLLGLDVKKVAKLEKDLNRLNIRAGKLGIIIFGGSVSTLKHGNIVVADEIGYNYDGGCGAIVDYKGVSIGETDTKETKEQIDELIKKQKICQKCSQPLYEDSYCDDCALQHCEECGSAEYQGDDCRTCDEENEED